MLLLFFDILFKNDYFFIEVLKNKTHYLWIVSLLFGNVIEVDW